MDGARPHTGPRGLFAERFALLYAEAGDPPLKRVTESVSRARRADERGQPVRVTVQRVSDWRRGRNVPARFAALHAVLEVLIGQARKRRAEPITPELYDLTGWRELWRKASESPTGEQAAEDEDTGVCPYRGLSSFRSEDSTWFFGRSQATAALVDALAAVTGTGGIVPLVGASGAGKSSLIAAGLLPALAGTGAVVTMTPGEDPVGELDRRLGGTDRDGTGTVLVVDQFEEVFTLCEDPAERRRFVKALRAAADRRTAVLLGMRADFYGHCLEHPDLVEALRDRQLVLGPMTTAELREAVVGPAKSVGLGWEPGLVELIMRDLGASGPGEEVHEAGVLPLLSHALLATWQRRQGGKLTLGGYRAALGIQGAVAATAERAWAELDAPERDAAKTLLLNLVRVGEDMRDTRRRSTRRRLLDQAEDPDAAAKVLEVLATARLVTLDAQSVEITHEALLHAWPRLRDWVERDRAGNLLRQRLEEDAAAWRETGRDASGLYRGARLEAAGQWLKARGPGAASAVAHDFLAASARHRRRTLWTRRAGVALVAVSALIAASVAVVAVRQRDDAQFRQVVSEADRLQSVDPSLSAQFDLVAHRLRPDDETVSTRILSTQQVPLATPFAGHAGQVYWASFSPDGTTVVTAGADRTVRLWDVRESGHPRPLGPPLTGYGSWIASANFSPDGHTLVTAGDDHTFRLFDVADPAHPRLLGSPLDGGGGTIYTATVSPDGHTLATANADAAVRLWNITDPARPVPIGEPLRGHTAAVRTVAFSPDGQRLASSGNDRTLRLWDLADPARPHPIGDPVTAHGSTVHSVTFSPDGRLLASASQDRTVRLWNVAGRATPEPVGAPLAGHTGDVWQVAFGPDGHTLASGGDSTVRLWNLADPADVTPLGKPLTGGNGSVFSVAFNPKGHTLVVGSEDGVTRLWSLPDTVLTGHTTSVTSLSFAKDRPLLATADRDDRVRLWNVADPRRPAPIGDPLPGRAGYVTAAALRPDGRVLAAGYGDDAVRLWDTSDPAHPKPLGRPLALDTKYGSPALFSPDGRTLVTGGDDHTLQVWDVTDPARPVWAGGRFPGHPAYVNSAAFSPDGRFLATDNDDNTVQLWDFRDPARPTALGKPISGHGAPVRSIAFDRGGQVLATGSDDQTVRLWTVADPANPAPVGRPLTGHTEAVNSVAFAPSGDLLVSGSSDRTLRLWDIADPAHPEPAGEAVTAGADATSVAAFSPSARFLVTGGGDATVRAWNLDVDDSRRRICATTGDFLTPEVWAQHLPQLEYEPPCAR
ncbi:WD40 repeat domain-containing protein [Amycolatopsis samaneae]|uniref:Novel STAND NTPase 1 domain-containing protein n=1 Tax=Amycolatopsis samaneae TaxID=664691 RepID=A0ABW5GLP0_9PSEU